MLHGTTHDMQERSEDLAKVIWAGMDEDKFLGPCKVCEEAGRAHEDGSPNRLRVIDMKRRQALLGLRGLQPRRPRAPGLVPQLGPAARARLRAVAPRGALLGLRRGAAADRQGLPRPPLEALPERRLPDDGRDAREARRAPGRRRKPARPRRPRPTRTATRDGEAAGAKAPTERQRRPPPPQATVTRHRPHEEGGLARPLEELAGTRAEQRRLQVSDRPAGAGAEVVRGEGNGQMPRAAR